MDALTGDLMIHWRATYSDYPWREQKENALRLEGISQPEAPIPRREYILWGIASTSMHKIPCPRRNVKRRNSGLTAAERWFLRPCLSDQQNDEEKWNDGYANEGWRLH